MKKPIISILLLAFLARLIFFFDYHEVWWDSSVYLGMGKYILSFGNQGLWEPLRPILWPSILGIFWKIKLNPILTGRIFTLVSSLAIVFLTYKIAETYYDKQTAIVSSILISFSTIFFFFNFRLYSEIPSLLFILLALYFIKKPLTAGIFISFAFLTKFPAGIFLIAFLPLIKRKQITHYILGFLIPTSLYLILNQILYNNPLLPFIEGSRIITQVAGCNILRASPWYSYFIWIIKENLFFLFIIPGIFLNKKKNYFLLLSIALPLLYFIQLNCREQRYIILFLPFIAILSAFAIVHLIKKKKLIMPFAILILLLSSIISINFYLNTETDRIILPKQQFLNYQSNKEIYTTNPAINTDKKLNLIYYPLFNKENIDNFKKIKPDAAIYIDSCSGGMSCTGEDCSSDEFIQYLHQNYNPIFKKEFGKCKYYIFE